MPRLRAMPGVAGVGLIQALPAIGALRESFAIEGATYPEERDYPLSNALLIGPGAFDALDVAVLQGRDFTDGDREGSRPVAIVNEGFVRRFFDGGDAIGRRIRIGTRDSQQDWRTIVGVVPDMFVGGLDDLDEPESIYIPIAQSSARFMTVLARARAGDP